jgi:Flp pilus assembly protein TadD
MAHPLLQGLFGKLSSAPGGWRRSLASFSRKPGLGYWRLFAPLPVPAPACAGGSPSPCPVNPLSLFQDVSDGTASGRGRRTLPPSLAGEPPAKKPAGQATPQYKRPIAILTEEEVAALVGPDPLRPEPAGPVQRLLAAGLVMVLAAVLAFLWFTRPAPPAPQPPRENPAIAQARAALAQGNPNQALDLLGLAATQGGSVRLAQINRLRAEALLARAGRSLDDRPDVALADVNSALALAPDWGEGFLQAGRLLTRMKLYVPALHAYIRSLEIDPGLHVAWFNLGYLYLEIQRHEQAIEAFRRAAALDPGLAADAYVNMSVSQARLGRRKEAVASLRQALEINPNHQTAREYLSKLLGKEPAK